MADPKADTDKTTSGAAETSSGGSGSGSGSSGSSGGSGGGGSGGSRGSGGSNSLMERVRGGGEKLTGQAAEKARGLVGQGLERSAEALANVGKLVSGTAEGLDERLGEDYGDYARRAAEAIDNAANGLAKKDPDELVDDTREFIRRSPGVALAGAAIAGFAIARLIKSGLSPDEPGEGRKRQRS